jgi:hypothetical protein
MSKAPSDHAHQTRPRPQAPIELRGSLNVGSTLGCWALAEPTTPPDALPFVALLRWSFLSPD